MRYVMMLVTLVLGLLHGRQSDATDQVSTLAPTCTAMGQVYAGDPSVYWGGCPTVTCAPNQCQVYQNPAHTMAWCACNVNPQVTDCKATISWAPGGDIAFWTCKKVNCGGACLNAPIPFGFTTLFELCPCG